MNVDSQQIVDAALKLPEAERAAVVEELLESLSPKSEVISDDEWFTELQRRSAEFRESREASMSWDELKRQE